MRTIPHTLLLVFCFSFVAVNAQGQLFPGLVDIKVDTLMNVHIYYQFKQCRVINKPNSVIPEFLDILETNLVLESQNKYLIQYCQGASADPFFWINRIDKDTLVKIGSIACKKLYVPGNGFLYSSGHSNNMFDTRRKFAVYRDSISEISQPFYYIGLNSRTTRDIVLFKGIGSSEEVAKLPKGTHVFVVANRGEYYLIKTEFGLLGWIFIPNGNQQTDLEGIGFAGD